MVPRMSRIVFGLALICGLGAAADADYVHIHDLCATTYISLESQTTYIAVTNATENFSPNRPCQLYLEACSSCQIRLRLLLDSKFDFFCRSGDTSLTSCKIGCDYLYVFDKYYMNETLRYYKKSELEFVSTSSSVFLGLCHYNSDRYNFTIEATVHSNTKNFRGSSVAGSTGVITSPFFNNGSYAQNHETYEFVFTSLRDDDYILLTFSDWHLASTSSLNFDNSNIQHRITGQSSRPMVISNSNKMAVQFHTGESLSADQLRPFVGFKANFFFVSRRNTALPSTMCKGSGYNLDSLGGSIDFVSTYTTSDFLDCIWVWKTQPRFRGIMMRVIKFQTRPADMRGDSELSIYDGTTSDGRLIKTYDTLDNVDRGIPVIGKEGFYVRINTKTKLETLKISYASFTDEKNCGRQPGMFLCGGRCIDSSLRCDDIDHCVDKSDETNCAEFTGQWDKSYEYTLTIGVIVPMVISVFLIMVLCFLFVMIRRCRRARLLQQGDGSVEQLGSISEDVSSRRGRRRRRRRRNQFPTVERDLPPSYSEAMENPPGWYINVAFGNPADPSLPSPPPYSEVAEECPRPAVPSTNQRTPGSPNSTDSSQSEVTLCSRNQSGSSSSSDEEDVERWDNVRRDGRHGRLSRHLSSSESDAEGGFAPIPSSVTQDTLVPTDNQDSAQDGSVRRGQQENERGKHQRRLQNQDSKELNLRKVHKKTNSSDDCVIPDMDKPRGSLSRTNVSETGDGVSDIMITGPVPMSGSRNAGRRTGEAHARRPPSSSRSVSTESDSGSLELQNLNRRLREANNARDENNLVRSQGRENVHNLPSSSGAGSSERLHNQQRHRLEPLSAENLYRRAGNRPNQQQGRSLSQLPNNGYGVIVNVDHDEIVVPRDADVTNHDTGNLLVPIARAPKLSAAVSMDTIPVDRRRMNEDARKKSQSEHNLHRFGLEPYGHEASGNSRRGHNRYELTERGRSEEQIPEDVVVGRQEDGGARFISLSQEDEDGGDIYV